MYRVGSIWKTKACLYTKKKLKWSSKPIETLGVTIEGSGELDKSNYDKVIKKLKEVCENWYYRKLTLLGRVIIVNTLMGSLFVYKMLVLASMSAFQLSEVCNVIQKFLWKGKQSRISMHTLTRKRNQGGVQLIDIARKQDAIKILALFQSETDKFLHHRMHQQLEPKLESVIWKCNISPQDVSKKYDTENFWPQALLAWSKIHYHRPSNKQEIGEQILWLNSHIKIKGETILWQKWLKQNVLRVGDITNDRMTPLLFTELQLKYPDLNTNWLEYKMLIDAIPQTWWHNLQNADSEYKSLYQRCMEQKKVAKYVYDRLIEDDGSTIAKYYNRWCDEGVDLEIENYTKAFKKWQYITKSTKLKDFQYRLLVKKLVWNSDLYEWGKAENEMCTFCKSEPETFKHVYLECKQLNNCYQLIQKILSQANAEYNLERIICSDFVQNTTSVINEVMLLIKQNIYSARCTECHVNTESVKWKIEEWYRIQVFNEKDVIKREKIRKTWEPILLSVKNHDT